MKSFIFSAMSVAMLATGCTGAKTNNADDSANAQSDNAATATDISGRWRLENIVFNDTVFVRPSEVAPGTEQFIEFDGDSYFIQTNCNTISGAYTLSGDSIRLNDGAMTEMACDNMAVEDALRKILPDIATIEVQNDSVIRLGGAYPAECIMLVKDSARQN